MPDKKLIYLVVDNHCSLCLEAIIESSQLDDTIIIIDRKLLELIEEEPDDIVSALKDVAKNWHEVSQKVIDEIKAKQEVQEYKDTTKIKKITDIVPYLISFGDDEDCGEVKIGSLAIDYIKSRIGDKK